MHASQQRNEPLASTDADPRPPAPPLDAEEAEGTLNAVVPPANPFARRVAELRRVMQDCVTNQEMEIIVGELMVQAQRGNLGAIKLLFQYILGKPAPTVDPDTLDLQELEQRRRAPDAATMNEIVTTRMPAEAACEILRAVEPYQGRALAEALVAPPPNSAPAPTEPPPHPAKGDSRPVPLPNGKMRADETRRTSPTAPPLDEYRGTTGNNGHPAPRRPVGS